MLSDVTPPSNLPGHHETEKFYDDTITGWTYLGGNFSSKDSRPVVTGVSDKSATVKGDRKGATAYRREISVLTANRPVIRRTISRNSTNGFVSGDVVTQRHISTYNSIKGTHFPARLDVLRDNARNEATTKSLLKVNSNQLQLAVDFAEAKKTVNLLATIASQSIYALRALRRGNIGLALKHLRKGGIPDQYLTFQYGVKPILSTVKSAYDLAKDHLEKDLIFYGKSTSKWSDSFSFMERGFQHNVEASGGHTSYLAARVNKLWLANATQFGLSDPLTVAWELIPFSFVVDWFVPIGNTLQGLTSGFGLELIDGYSTSFGGMRDTAFDPIPCYMSPGDYELKIDNGLWQKEYRFVEREPHVGFPLPGFYAKSSNPFSTTHVLNGLALLNGLRR